MVEETYALKYPRRVFARRVLRNLSQATLKLLTRTTVNGREHIPARGPLIVVGNHVDMFEVVLMVAAVPLNIEMLAAGDVPMMTPLDPAVNAYGYIPVNRGNMDRKAMNMALDVLNQKGVIGIFPEGGIWDTGVKQVHTGVAWLSSKANAPILPMGFGGVVGAIGAMVSLRRPRMTVNIGELMPPIVAELPGMKRREILAAESQRVMERIESLVPSEEKARLASKKRETYELQVEVKTHDGLFVQIPQALCIRNDLALAQILCLERLLETLYRNLQLPVHAMKEINRHSAHEVAAAAQVVLDYLKNDNPNYFNYRFGYERGREMGDSVAQLRDLAQWVAEKDYVLRVKAIRRQMETISPEPQGEGELM